MGQCVKLMLAMPASVCPSAALDFSFCAFNPACGNVLRKAVGPRLRKLGTLPKHLYLIVKEFEEDRKE